MEHHKHYLILTLPDQSTAVMDTKLRFYSFAAHPASWKDAIEERITTDAKAESNLPTGNINLEHLASLIERPHLPFGDCFRRLGSQARYSFRFAKHKFNVVSLAKIYQFRGSGSGGMFSSSHAEWKFLDGGIVSHSGYGWGSHTWIAVEGAEALRVVCVFFGIRQPLRIKGEGTRESLAVLLERMTANDVGHGSRSYYYAGQQISKTICGRS